MNGIIFSHKYKKLLTGSNLLPVNVRLLQVFIILKSDLTSNFLEYDTENIFKLPETDKFLLLIFKKPGANIFTTIRSYNEGKELFYKSKVGEFFKVILK